MSLQEQTDNNYMQRALELAELAFSANEVPIGAVLVHNDSIIAEAHNETIAACDPSAHAEILVLRRAAKQLANHRLLDTTLYVTVEPCLMCCGGALHARVARLVFGANEPKTGAVISTNEAFASVNAMHHVRVKQGVMAEPCAELLRRFFSTRR